MGHPDEIRATKISSRLNKGNKDLTGQVGQADKHKRNGIRNWEGDKIEGETVRRWEGV
jgi:hypothetical protein